MWNNTHHTIKSQVPCSSVGRISDSRWTDREYTVNEYMHSFTNMSINVHLGITTSGQRISWEWIINEWKKYGDGYIHFGIHVCFVFIEIKTVINTHTGRLWWDENVERCMGPKVTPRRYNSPSGKGVWIACQNNPSHYTCLNVTQYTKYLYVFSTSFSRWQDDTIH